MRIAAAVVSPDGMGDANVTWNVARERWACSAIDVLKATSPDDDLLLVLPAGFLAAGAPADVDRVARSVLAHGSACGVTVVLGVDVLGQPRSKTTRKKGTSWDGRCLPFAVVTNATHRREFTWQRSATGKDGRSLPGQIARQRRVICVGRERVEVLLCGEVFSPGIRDGILRRAPRAVVVLAHTAQGARHDRGIVRLSRDTARPVSVLRAVHAIGGAKTYWQREGDPQEQPLPRIDDNIWLDVVDFP